MLLERRWIADRGDLSIEQENGFRGKGERFRNVVVGEHDRDPLPREVGENPGDSSRADRIDACEGLIANQDSGGANKGARELETAALAGRELPGRDIEPLPELDPTRARDRITGIAMDDLVESREVPTHREVPEHARRLRHIPDAFAGPPPEWPIRDVGGAKENAAARQRELPHERSKEGRLAGARGAENGQDGARARLDVHPAQDFVTSADDV